MSFYFVGDLHGHHDIKKLNRANFPDEKKITEQELRNRFLCIQTKAEFDNISDLFEDLVNHGLKFKKWFYGHFHVDYISNNYICLYNEIYRESFK